MSNPTTPFGWQMPTATDLVTDLPADFEVFGQAVATSMADLLGGTTGQVLSKTTNADMDFTWVTTDDANAIQNSIVDAKGDLIAATAADTPARLAVGTNGHVLTADSTAATGIKWAAPAAGGKLLQVVNATTSTQITTTSATFVDGGLTATITPTSATSKILVLFTQAFYLLRSTDQCAAGYQILRNATSAISTDVEAFYVYVGTGANAAQRRDHATVHFMDSPASTSALTYKVQWKVGSSTLILQPGIPDTSSITLMEIGA